MQTTSEHTTPERGHAGAVGEDVAGQQGHLDRLGEGLDLDLDGQLVLDAQWQIVEINTRALALLNCRMQTLQGFDLWDVVPEEIAEQYQANTINTLISLPYHAFVAHDKFEGSWIEFTFRKHGDVYIVRLRDVASVKKLNKLLDDSERTNKLIFEVNPNAMWVFDSRSLRILAVNRAAIEFYGIPQNRFLTLTMGALFPENEGGVLLDFLNTSQARQKICLDPLLCKQIKADSKAVLVELACAYVSWSGHAAVLVSLADVSGRHVAARLTQPASGEQEQVLASLRHQLKNTEFDLTTLTYGLSNDLRGPLHAVNGFAAILADKYASVLGDAGQHYVRRIQGGTRQMAKLVHYLLTLVQLPPASSKLGMTNLAPICRAIIEDLRSSDHSRTVTVEIDADMPLLVDKNLLTAALACLLENAWKFTSKKTEGWIKIGLQPGKQHGEMVLHVMDNGAGFDPVYADKLFTVFQRLHSSAEFPGNGLGLAIVKRVAERHGGCVFATTDHTGASFFMSLPQQG